MSTAIIFTGLTHLIGNTVYAMIGGLLCGPYTVGVTGSIAVTPVTDNAFLTGEYLQGLDVGPYDKVTYGDATTQVTMQINGAGIMTMYVPVTIGCAIPFMGTTMRPTSEQLTKSPAGGAIGKLKRSWAVSALVTCAQGINFGTTPSNGQPAPLLTDSQIAIPPFDLYNGVLYQVLNSAHDFNGQITWSSSTPYPFILNSLVAYIETEERQ